MCVVFGVPLSWTGAEGLFLHHEVERRGNLVRWDGEYVFYSQIVTSSLGVATIFHFVSYFTNDGTDMKRKKFLFWIFCVR